MADAENRHASRAVQRDAPLQGRGDPRTTVLDGGWRPGHLAYGSRRFVPLGIDRLGDQPLSLRGATTFPGQPAPFLLALG